MGTTVIEDLFWWLLLLGSVGGEGTELRKYGGVLNRGGIKGPYCELLNN